MVVREEERREIGNPEAFGCAACSAAEACEMTAEIGVEGFDALGQPFACEMGSVRKNGGVSLVIVREGDVALSLWTGFQQGPEVSGSASVQMKADDPSAEMTQRYPEPDDVFLTRWNARPHQSQRFSVAARGPAQALDLFAKDPYQLQNHHILYPENTANRPEPHPFQIKLQG